MTSPFFSIAIPAFKKAFLKESLDSILAQSFQDFEVIIINDNSPEDLSEIIFPFQNEIGSDRLNYQINNPGFGGRNVTYNWDNCLKSARGKYFICMGDDDRLLPDCLQLYHKAIESHPSKSVFHIRTQIIDESSQIINLQNSASSLESVFSMIWRRWNGMWTSYIGDYCFKRSTLLNLGGFHWMPFGRYSDYLTVYEATGNNSCVMIDDFGFQYRVNQLTLTHKTDNQKEKAEAELLYKTWVAEFLSRKTNNEQDEWFRQSLLNSFDNYFIDRFSMIIKDDICYNGLDKVIRWMNSRNTYGLSAKQVILAFLSGIKKRIS